MAAAGGNLKVLMWLRGLGCPWDSATSAAAFQEGHLEVLSWLGQQTPPCPWACDDLICPAKDAIGDSLLTLIPQQPTVNKPHHKLLGQALDPRILQLPLGANRALQELSKTSSVAIYSTSWIPEQQLVPKVWTPTT